ncbi:MAG: hypothetical protein DWQ37_04065 [Planctomycetota bacterium]|nr:MAG: hypothetical protein DWQ37_04065 [Planctomycetota bacterium]
MVDSRFKRPAIDSAAIATLLDSARTGDDGNLGQLLEATRRYLLLVANGALDAQLRQKVAASDLVQETLVDACRDFYRFQGNTEGELLAWLSHILRHKAADVGRAFRGTAKRSVAAEQAFDRTQSRVELQVADELPSPSTFAVQNENKIRLVAAIDRLPQDYRHVIELRNFDRLSFAEIGKRMGRSDDAAGKLWFRAIQKLRDELAEPHESPSALAR